MRTHASVMAQPMVWMHVAAAAVWIGASACVMIAAGAMGPDSADFRAFALRVLPAITRLNLFAAAIVFSAGAVRLVELGAPIGYQFSTRFLCVFGAKMILFAAMAGTAVWSYKAQSRHIRGKAEREVDTRALAAMVARAAPLAGLAVAMGGLAAALGLWLAGSV